LALDEYNPAIAGRYSTATGAIVDMEQNVARGAHHFVALGLSGPTSARPQSTDLDVTGGVLPAGPIFFDTTLSSTCYWTGQNWRDAWSGDIV
jgi:hypothetical protein